MPGEMARLASRCPLIPVGGPPQALWFYCQPPMAAMQLLAALAAAAAKGRLRGATLLDLLHERAGRTAGDANARRLLQRLLRAACAPYFRCSRQQHVHSPMLHSHRWRSFASSSPEPKYFRRLTRYPHSVR